jgi:glucokinase
LLHPKEKLARFPGSGTENQAGAIMAYLLTADIGGTNARFGLVPRGELHPRTARIMYTADSPSPQAAARRFLDEAGNVELIGAVIAWAGHVGAGPLKLTNGPWVLDRAVFAAELGIDDLRVINDFEAVALAIDHLGPGDVVQVGGNAPAPRGVRAVMGPGTGLGTATLVPVGDNGWRVLPGEGGHTNPPLAGPAETALWPALFTGIDHPVAENVLSGPGITRTYRAIAASRGETPVHDNPGAVCQAALAGDAVAAAAFELFFTWLGRMAGDLALIVGATGGVYIAGGIVPKYLEPLNASPFRAAFEAKGLMADFARTLPAFVVVTQTPALIGCAAAHAAQHVA